MKIVLFVCQGNVFRSPVAEAILNKKLSELGLSDSIICISRGIQGQSEVSAPKYNRFDLYVDEYQLAESVFRESNIDISNHVSKPMDLETLQSADLIIALGDAILNGAGGINGYGEGVTKKTIIYEIPDPFEESGLNKYRVVVPKIMSIVDELTPTIIDLLVDSELNSELGLAPKNGGLKERLL